MAKKNPRSKPSPTEHGSPARARVKDLRSTSGAPRSAEDPRELGVTLGQTIRSAAPDIVQARIEQAKAGNSTPAKFLFDFAGLSSAGADDAVAEECLAALLLKELARPPNQGSAEPGTVQ